MSVNATVAGGGEKEKRQKNTPADARGASFTTWEAKKAKDLELQITSSYTKALTDNS